MAATSSSIGKLTVPHTRIVDERQIEEEYEIGRKLGQGGFGVVREVRHQKDNETWACKTINKEKAGSSAISLLEQEVMILKQVHHEHIIRLKEVFETSRKMYLVMELCEGGELADAVREKGRFREEDARVILGRLTSAISYLHKKGMVHRDIKLENILLANNPNDKSDNLYIKVTDFGLSVVKGGVSQESMMMDFCGTPIYMAPEIIENKSYSEKCDVWAMGVIVYILLCGQPPFISKDEEKLYEIIKTADVSKQFKLDPIWGGISTGAKDCICGMLTVDPAHRLTAHEVADHPWVKGGGQRPLNVLQMMKDWNTTLDEVDDSSANRSEDTVVSKPESKLKPPQAPTQNGTSNTSQHRRLTRSTAKETKHNKNNNNTCPHTQSGAVSSETATTSRVSGAETKHYTNNNQHTHQRRHGGPPQSQTSASVSRSGNSRQSLLTSVMDRSASKSPIDGAHPDRVDGRRPGKTSTTGQTSRTSAARPSNGATKDVTKQLRSRKS